jgi:serine/threonine protein kinase
VSDICFQVYDKSVDWWCLGAVLFEMLYGLPPFYSRNRAEMYDRIVNKPLRLRPTISASARDILVKVCIVSVQMALYDMINKVKSLFVPYHALIRISFIYVIQTNGLIQGGSNMAGTNCDLFTHNQPRSYLNHLV